MKNSRYQEILKNDLFEPIYELTEKKAHDYAKIGGGDEDTLSNFKHQASMREVRGAKDRASDVAFDFVLTKLARLGNLRDKEPRNEAVLDSVRDAINYLGLYYACRLEESSAPSIGTTFYTAEESWPDVELLRRTFKNDGKLTDNFNVLTCTNVYPIEEEDA
jgi:hypothetical protein